MPRADQERVCFVIAPIGEEDTDIRRRSDQVLNHIIVPAAEECGYTPLRADQISEPGIITAQVIQHLVDDPLVVADLTGHNPNVFYELAVRHALRRPVVQLIEADQPIPFDVGVTRTIRLNHRDLDSAADCRQQMVRQIRAVERDASLVDNPISVAIDLQSLGRSANPLEKSNAEIISMLQELRAMVADLRKLGFTADEANLHMRDALAERLLRVEATLTLAPRERATKERFQRARYQLRATRRALGIQTFTESVSGSDFSREVEKIARDLAHRDVRK